LASFASSLVSFASSLASSLASVASSASTFLNYQRATPTIKNHKELCKYRDAIDDCTEVLKIDDKNLEALAKTTTTTTTTKITYIQKIKDTTSRAQR